MPMRSPSSTPSDTLSNTVFVGKSTRTFSQPSINAIGTSFLAYISALVATAQKRNTRKEAKDLHRFQRTMIANAQTTIAQAPKRPNFATPSRTRKHAFAQPLTMIETLPPVFKPTIATISCPAPLYNPIPAHIQNHQPQYRCYVLIFAKFGHIKALFSPFCAKIRPFWYAQPTISCDTQCCSPTTWSSRRWSSRCVRRDGSRCGIPLG